MTNQKVLNENKEQCPCKRSQCERRGHCSLCRKHHETIETRYRVACDRIQKKNHR